ncbi:iron/zinc/copper transport system substrate-binding protein [Anaerosphaera aminiphila DSM 21120]|uniref:Iron/zinc/copper transport system substrate-binding protein n=1 Tax=Anaerosphaera aminiphila DSM 21120 TaxID=1120995 RepID=A0A1M5UES4_9FIRM|nr:metal ABC transporter substrate-binding protein [Anaerosphaera aminiphila]SHH61398.1 iron/zinc/copper transport system substrate-binding protein [Anaerosphaera aminiphila DSM 21120]
MKKICSIFISSLLILTALTGCSKEQGENTDRREIAVQESQEKLKIVTTNSILGNLVENVVGNNADVYSIVPVGIDPHEYEPLPKDIQEVDDADIIFYNGLNLETGGNGWFVKLMESTLKKEDVDFFAASKKVEPMYLTSSEKKEEQDPHAWLDIQNGIKYVENIRDVLVEKDSKNKNIYEENTNNYIKKLQELDTQAKEEFADIPEDKKMLVSSEGAFKYFSKAYGLTAAYIWEINTENQGTPEQMTKVIDTIRNWNIPSLFVETSVDSRSMEQVSRETGIPIYEKLFTDSIAKKGTVGDSYYSMMQWNLDKIHEGLSK